MDIKVRKIAVNWTQMPTGLTWYFIGAPKTGKTTQASSWHKDGSEKVLLLDTDLGADFAENANVIHISSLNPPTRYRLSTDGKFIKKDGENVIEDIPPLERGFYYRTGKHKGDPIETYSLQEVFVWLTENWDKLPYEVIAIDTVDQINEWIERRMEALMDVGSIADIEWGAGWAKARKENMDLIKRYQTFCKSKGVDFILTSHSKQTSVTDGKVQLSPELPRGLAASLTAKADVIGYTSASKEDSQFYISFMSYDERMIGSRLKPLVQKKLLFNYDTIMNEVKNYNDKEGSNAKKTSKK